MAEGKSGTGPRKEDAGQQAIKKIGAVNGAKVGAAAGAAAGIAASAAVGAAATGTATSLTVGAGFAPFVAALGAAKVASLPAALLFLATPLGAAVGTGVLAVAGAAAGYKIAKVIAKKL